MLRGYIHDALHVMYVCFYQEVYVFLELKRRVDAGEWRERVRDEVCVLLGSDPVHIFKYTRHRVARVSKSGQSPGKQVFKLRGCRVRQVRCVPGDMMGDIVTCILPPFESRPNVVAMFVAARDRVQHQQACCVGCLAFAVCVEAARNFPAADQLKQNKWIWSFILELRGVQETKV